MGKQLFEYLDCVRGMAILLVLLGHMYNVEDPITNTLIIMATQQIIINYINRFTKQQYYLGFKGLYMFLIVIIEIPIIYIINNYASLMLGKFKNKDTIKVV